MTVAVLYIDPRGPYASMPNVDAWDETRDARMYDGPYPVVAHPPCGPWSELRHLSRRPQDLDCAPRALADVRRWGGVLEHPHRSKFWAAADVPAPGEAPDAWGGWTIDVDQVSWGHVARKRTRLYFVGVTRDAVAATLRTGGTPTHWCSGSRAHPGRKGGGVVPPGIKVCSAQQRRRTPPLLAAWLVSLAEKSSVFTPPGS